MPAPAPDWTAYGALEAAGLLHGFAASIDGALVGFVTVLSAALPRCRRAPRCATPTAASRAPAGGSALRDSKLMERVRKDATTEGAIAAGVSAAGMMVPIPKSSRRAPLSLVMRVPAINARARGFDSFRKFKEAIGNAPPGYDWHHIVGQTIENIKRFDAKKIHNTNNLVLLPNGPGSIHSQISALFGSERDYSKNMLVRNWIG